MRKYGRKTPVSSGSLAYHWMLVWWKFWPSTCLSTNEITALNFDTWTAFWLFERSVKGQNDLHFSSNPRYSTRDHCIQESLKWIFNSGMFWAVGAAEREKKSKLPLSMLLLRSVSMVKKKNNHCSVHTKKVHSIQVRFFFLNLESILFWVKIGKILILK